MQPISVDLILNCRWLIPIVPENQIIERHAIIIKAGRILEILPIADASNKYSANKIENLDHHAVMPGLINSQAHGATRLFRGNDSGSASPANKTLLADQNFITASTELAIAEMLKDTGIKTKIIKQYLPVMNQLINKYLQVLDFYVHFNLDEEFNETIRSRHRD
ncbi:MAG: hypothetical protein HN886_08370, partial [Woeseiaceae bacterium]|nr:hypothetical protein [Woeseiaceae bacterium]